MAKSCRDLTHSRRRLARIRCLSECIECFKQNQQLPLPLCYVPAVLEYKAARTARLTLYEQPDKHSKKFKEILLSAEDRLLVTGEEFCNSQGQWAKWKSIILSTGTTIALEKGWVLLYGSQSQGESSDALQLVQEDGTVSCHERIHGKKLKEPSSWEEVVENEYALRLGTKLDCAPSDTEAVERMHILQRNWTIECDEHLAQFLCSNTETENDNLGSIKNYVESIDVSTFSEDEGPENLTDGNPDTYWESDGNQGQHYVRLSMKKGTVIKKLIITIDANDDNFMPYGVVVMGGELGSLKKINDVSVDQSLYGVNDITVLEDQKEHYQIVEIRIKECKDDGIDTRIHAIKIKSTKERDLGLNYDLFKQDHLVRFPKLEGFSADVLYRRAHLLQRFVTLLDSVLPYIVPLWEHSIASFPSLEIVRQLLPLSKKRISLIDKFLRDSETIHVAAPRRLYINRRAAAEHKADPSLDSTYKQTVFSQVVDGLKPRTTGEVPLDYRWSSRHDQWWECKFIGEGIIDQGGGFRDSLSDLADELCPSASDVPVPLPFFIRAPNQNTVDGNVNQDVYTLNPSCKDMTGYEWIGKLMGACFRGKENLVLSLPSFVWKKLSGERVTWSRDFITVDEAEVRMMEQMETMMDEETFWAYFEDERTWSTALSDGGVVALRQGGAEMPVEYQDRQEYPRLVQHVRMAEIDEQVAALKRGLLSVIPQAVIDLLTWQELERRICGDPTITVEALKRSTHYEDVEEDDNRVKFMWQALTNFSMEDRSRFLRFVTGRRRLPAPLYICPDKGETADALPESSTCSNTLYLPNYSSPTIAEEKLRYASYNCIAIDTDMSPWDV